MDVPVAQAGMGGGLAGPDLAITVAQARGLGTLGWVPADWLHKSIRRMPASVVDRTALYAGESVLRMDSVISARQAVADLAGS